MKPNCDEYKNNPAHFNAMREICNPCIFEIEKPKRESICFNCEHSSYCKNALLYDDESSIVMKGCSRFKEKHKQTNADRIRAMTDEELAEFMCHNVSNGTVNCAFCSAEEFCRMGHNGWLDWLQKECE